MARLADWNRGDPGLMQWITDHGLNPHRVINIEGDPGPKKAVATVAELDDQGRFIWTEYGGSIKTHKQTFKVKRPLPTSAVIMPIATGEPFQLQFYNGLRIEDDEDRR